MSERAPQSNARHGLDGLSEAGAAIVAEEREILAQVAARIEREASREGQQIENLDQQLIELRDQIAEAKEEDVASLVEQMHQVAALSQKRGKGRSLPVDPNNPYFGHLRLRDAQRGRTRDVLIGKRTLLDDGQGMAIVDWRNAPISRLYYRYEESEEYEEEFDERSLEGKVLVRRSVAVTNGRLRRIGSPQGTFVSNRQGEWRDASSAGGEPSLGGGAGAAIRVPRGQLGVNEEDDPAAADKHLQEITALIDKEQFGLITKPESGIVLIQGGAGSGKTTVALHRVAYLAFQDPERFAPRKMLVMVFNEALVEYIRHVLPALGIEGVPVTTYRRWTLALLRRVKLDLPVARHDSTPEAVARFKKHPALLGMMHAHVEGQRAATREELVRKIEGREGADAVLAAFDEHARLPWVRAVQRSLDSLERGALRIPARARAIAQSVLESALEEAGDVVADWIEMMGDHRGLAEALADPRLEFSEGERQAVETWCARRAGELDDWVSNRRNGSEDEGEDERDEDDELVREELSPPELDGEDDAIFLRLMQLKYGGLYAGNRRIEYEHIVIDEAQDLCPIEVRVLLDCASEGRSITIAGDKAQKMIFDNGFRDWPTLLEDAGLPHVAVQPLKITYRSTRQIMDVAHHVLGPLHDEDEAVVAREGAAVSYYEHSDMGESVAFLAESLRSLLRREPTASVAIITRFPQQASTYYEGLRVAEVPNLRLVIRQDFSFSAGIDVTDVRQVKGLEFDYVIVVDPTDQNYPETVASRHLMHIACTRSAYQLWFVNSGNPSKLIPPALVEAGELLD